MAQEIQNVALDKTLDYIKDNASVLHICSQAPTTYAQVATYSLASKSGLTISSPNNRLQKNQLI